MKFKSTLFMGVLSSALLISSPSTVAETEVSASVAVASSYLFRGVDLGSGTPAVSGDITVSNSGFYTGIWASSGDTANGTEYDLYIGYGSSIGENFSYDISLWNYVYPTGEDEPGDDAGEFSELILTFGYGPISFTYADNVAGGNGYEYIAVTGTAGPFSLTYGLNDNPNTPNAAPPLDMVHVDLNYAYNDNLNFTLSQQVEDEEAGDDLKVVVSYSFPLDL